MSILCKNAQLQQKYIFPQIPTHSDPDISGPTPSYAANFFSPSPEVSKKGMLHPSRVKTHRGDRF